MIFRTGLSKKGHHRILLKALQITFRGQEISAQESDALLKICFAISFVLQIIACHNAEFSVEQGEAGNFWEPLHYLLYGTGVQNFEWSKEYAIRSPIYLLPLFLVGKCAQLLPLTKLQVFFVMRHFVAMTGTFALYLLARAARNHIGNAAPVIGFLMAIFNHCILFFLGRLGIDTFTAILHCIAAAAWMERRYERLIWICAITVFFRVNFLVIAAAMGLHVLVYACPSNQTIYSWFWQLLHQSVLALTGVGLVVFITDSLWYGRPALSTWNFIAFNMMQDGSSNFGRMPLWFYLDKLLLDNNLIISVNALLSMLLLTRESIFMLPSLALLVSLALIEHKEYRFLYAVQPILALHAGLLLHRLPALTTALTHRLFHLLPRPAPTHPCYAASGDVSTWGRSAGRVVTWSVVSVHVVNGLSLVCLQAYLYAPHAAFARLVAARLHPAAVGGALGQGCLCSFPWCSWLLPEGCRGEGHVVCVYEDFFPGYSHVTYRRFEHPARSALVDMAPEPDRHNYTYMHWRRGMQLDPLATETRRMRRLAQGGRSWAAAGGSLAALGVGHVLLLEISSSPQRVALEAYAAAAGHPPREATVTHHLYHELLLGPALAQAGMVEVERAVAAAEPGVFNVEVVHRLLFSWPLLSRPAPHYLVHSYWALPPAA